MARRRAESIAYLLGAAFSFLVPLLVYLRTLAPGLFWRDAPEFSLVPFLLDISHPPGSPTYTLLGKLFSFLPLGGVSLRANLLSALVGAGAVLALYLAALEISRRVVPDRADEPGLAPLRAAAAAGAACLLSLATAVWYWAVVAEVYTLLLLFLAACAHLAAGLLDEASGRSAARAALLALVAGLGAGVHPDLILALPATALFLLALSGRRLRGAGAWTWPFFLALGLSVYLFLPVRSATPLVYDYGNPETLSQFLAHVTARAYAERVYHYPWSLVLAHWARVPWMIAGQLGFVALVLGAVGAVVLALRAPVLLGLFAAWLLGNLWLVKDWTAAFGYLPVFLVFALLATAGAVFLGDLAMRRLVRAGVRLVGMRWNAGLALLALLAAVAQLGRGWTLADKGGHRLAERHGRAALDSLPEGAVLISSEDHLSYMLHYLQYVENYRTDVAHIHRAYLPFPEALAQRWPELGWPPEVLSGRRPALDFLLDEIPRHPLFLDRSEGTAGMIPVSRLAPHGIVYRVLAAPTAELSEDDLAAHAGLLARRFEPILADPWFAEPDWTAREVYASIFNGLGDFFFRRGYRALAGLSFRRAREVCPEGPQAYFNLASFLLAEGDPEGARDVLERGLRILPRDPDLLVGRAQWAERTGQPEQAVRDYEEALAVDPGRDRARLGLAAALVAAGRADAALPHLRRVWEEGREPASRARAGVALARVRAAEGDVTGARRLAHQALLLAPDDPDARQLIAKLGP